MSFLLPPRAVVLTTGTALGLMSVAACTDLERREFGDQYIPSPDTLANIGDDDGAADDEDDEPDDGAADDAPADDDAGADDSAVDDGNDDAADDAPSDDDAGADDSMDGDPLDDDGGDTGPPESPYIGGWDIGTCQSDTIATGSNVGQVLPDFTLMDQHGDMVRLYDFCHKAVWLIEGAFW